MRWNVLLWPSITALWIGVLAPAQAQSLPADPVLQPGDEVVRDMQRAFARRDKAKLTQLLPAARGHTLEPWAAYWELRARLQEATPAEVQDFLTRWAGTYHEDRLRNDWLRLLGQRRDWGRFDAMLPAFRMGDDRELRCYAAVVSLAKGNSDANLASTVKTDWYAQRDAEDGCSLAAAQLYSAGKLTAADVWRRARQALENGRPRAARAAVEIVAPMQLQAFAAMLQSPSKFLHAHAAKLQTKEHQELASLALIKIAADNPDSASALMNSRWSDLLAQDKHDWIWGVIGKTQATRLSPDALAAFAKVGKTSHLASDMLTWKARAALRAGQWQTVRTSIEAMDDSAKNEPTWIYWHAKALQAGRASDAQAQQARLLLQKIAAPQGFYEQLALEALGQKISLAAQPAAVNEQARHSVRNNPGLVRALYAIELGLRSEGVREWNYTTSLHQRGGMADNELLAAAELACQRQVWDRCISTSERTQATVDVHQRFPMPLKDAVLSRAQLIGLDPAYVYGLIRQESRFVMDARSGVGASGLMQIMPATARWTARKIGMADFTPSSLNEPATNIALGTAYLKIALDDFDGSMVLASAAYNAGPGRPRTWRNGPVLDAAIWIENIPFGETREYVKKVLANTTSYAALITGQPQSLNARLGSVGPRLVTTPDPSNDLP